MALCTSFASEVNEHTGQIVLAREIARSVPSTSYRGYDTTHSLRCCLWRRLAFGVYIRERLAPLHFLVIFEICQDHSSRTDCVSWDNQGTSSSTRNKLDLARAATR